VCLQDYAIGFGTFTSERIVSVGLTSQLVVQANPNRSVLIFAHPTANVVYLSTINPATASQGIHLGSTDQATLLTVPWYGNLAAKAWYGIATGGTAPMSVFEGEFDLQRIEEFFRQFKQRL
jgi:hypothetical protein